MVISKAIGWLLVAVALSGCARGGASLSGEDAVAAPQPPAQDEAWLNGRADLSALRGQVILVEAFHPS